MKKLLFTLSLIMSITATYAQTQERSNPFFESWTTPYEIPPFEEITLADYREGLLKGIEEYDMEINAIATSKKTPTFENTILAYDAAGALLNKVGGVFYSQCSANGTKEMLDLQREITPLMTQMNNKVSMNKELFARIKQVKETVNPSSLGDEEKMLLEEIYSGFIRNGALLEGKDAEKLKTLNERISVLQNRFSQNLLAETGAYSLIIDNEQDLTGLSDDAIASAAGRAVKGGLEGKWVFGLDNPSIMPFLYYNANGKLREEILQAYLNRGNNNNEQDNKQLIVELVTARDEKAKLLGYPNFAEYALEKRMAKSAQTAYDLLDQIWTPALNRAKEERAEMQQVLNKEGGKSKLRASDWRYYSEKVKHEKYNLSDEMLRPYFKAQNVREGIFWVANQLYGITFKQLTNVPKPHADAEAFVCLDNDNTELGVLFVDLYARPGLKRGGAWCGTYRSTYRNVQGERVMPQTYITCNFTPPVAEEPALLTPDEVETFFHEFGHALHNLFKINKYHGTLSVPRDFVELPSQIMEHWAFEPRVLTYYAKHYQTGEVIPQELIDKMQASAKYGQGFATTEFLAAALLDMDYHVNPNPADIQVLEFEASTLGERGLISEIPPRYRSTYFQHTFTGGYAAGYYSYIWSEVLDADAFQAFVETGDIFNKEVAEKFRREILQQGGIYPADQMYFNFRGKNPGIEGLLKNRGL